MKERLVESWLTKINERGYGIPFCQILASKGYRVVRYGHSSIELGKDVLAIAPDGAVCAYQLKSGDVSLADLNKHIEQLQMLVAAQPMHPALPTSFEYRVFLVTTGDFKDPAIALIKELNAKWRIHKWTELQTIGGKELLVDLLAMSSDFWPAEAPDMRAFLELHLADGRGDLDSSKLAKLLKQIVGNGSADLALERRAAAANIFCSYALSAFYAHEDHWGIFQAWTICAATVVHAGESGGCHKKFWFPAFELAKEGATIALRSLRAEVLGDGAFHLNDRELDEYTRLRNTTAIAAASAIELIEPFDDQNSTRLPLLKLIAQFIGRDRLIYWGEGAFSQFMTMIWLMDASGSKEPGTAVIQSLLGIVINSNSRDAQESLDDPYVTSDQHLVRLIAQLESKNDPPRKKSIQSYTLLPLVVLAVRRGLRSELEAEWRKITRVRMTWFKPDKPVDLLLWHCDSGREQDAEFEQPQSWAELHQFALRDDQERLPSILRDDTAFAVMFMLAFPHRIALSLIKWLDAKAVTQ